MSYELFVSGKVSFFEFRNILSPLRVGELSQSEFEKGLESGEIVGQEKRDSILSECPIPPQKIRVGDLVHVPQFCVEGSPPVEIADCALACFASMTGRYSLRWVYLFMEESYEALEDGKWQTNEEIQSVWFTDRVDGEPVLASAKKRFKTGLNACDLGIDVE